MNPFAYILKSFDVDGEIFRYYDIAELDIEKYSKLIKNMLTFIFEIYIGICNSLITFMLISDKLPYSIRVLLEIAVRNCDNFHVHSKDVQNILNWEENQIGDKGIEVPFKPSRVILQDFTGVPAVVDFAAMRDAVRRLGGNPDKINPVCPSDLVIDHSVQVDFSGS